MKKKIMVQLLIATEIVAPRASFSFLICIITFRYVGAYGKLRKTAKQTHSLSRSEYET